MSLIAVIVICVVELVIFVITLLTKGVGFVLDILTTPQKLITLMIALAIVYAVAAFISNM